MATGSFKSVSEIMEQVGGELALWAAADLDTDFVTTSADDANQNQMFYLLRGLCAELVRQYSWLQATKQHDFNTSATVTSYVLPDDFYSYVDGTGWNRTSRQPLVPISPQQWQALQASGVTGLLYVLFRPRERTLELLADPGASQTIAFEYNSLWVASPDGASVPTKALPGATDDIVWIDSHLFERALKLRWLRHKGFDSTAAQQEYDDALNAARGANASPAPVLSLDKRAVDPLGAPNVPETGLGQ